ncbi:MAG TPA: HEAT repeat domain-containing protein [candidate division Zixibacteria bacterium]|nr:HEAT repeat domain-containing protein [candidate division Zixibacteria bacterium]
MISRQKKTTGVSGQRRRKQIIKQILTERDFSKIETITAEDPNVLRALAGLLFDNDRLACWQAIEALGFAASVQAKTDLEKVRRLIRSQFWHMNDESGNIGWFAAEAIGETIHAVPELADEFGGMLPAFFIEEPFEQGAHWAVARIAAVRPDIYKPMMPLITKSLAADDPHIRLYTLWVLRELGIKFIKGTIRELEPDDAPVSFYSFETGQMVDSTVGAEATKILTNS